MISTKPNRCKECRERMPPEQARHVLHEACIPAFLNRMADKKAAARKKAEAAKRKVEKAVTRQRREKLKTRADWHKDAQKAVNTWVRVNDQGKPCISCGKPWEDTFQAGHYRSRGAAKHLALEPMNIHGQCVRCNMHLHGNAIMFRAGLVERYGINFVEVIEADNSPRKHSIADLKEIRTEFVQRTKNLLEKEV